MKIESLFSLLPLTLTVVAYFTGFGYLTGYYEFYDIDLWEIGPSVQDVLSYAVPPLQSTVSVLYKLIAGGLIVAVFIAFVVEWRTIKRLALFDLYTFFRRSVMLATSLVAVAAILTMLSGPEFGRKNAAAQMNDLKYFQLSKVTAEEVEEQLQELRNIYPSPVLEYFRITTTKETNFFLIQLSGSEHRWVAREHLGDGGVSLTYLGP